MIAGTFCIISRSAGYFKTVYVTLKFVQNAQNIALCFDYSYEIYIFSKCSAKNTKSVI